MWMNPIQYFLYQIILLNIKECGSKVLGKNNIKDGKEPKKNP